MKPSQWPRLSQTLPKGAHPHLCGNCEGTRDLQIWIEHDASDQPERVMINLCRRCSDILIEPHPRLYAQAPVNAPIPGAMKICVDCTQRKGLTCMSPQARFNGGPGMEVTAAKPMVVHIDGRDTKGRRYGRWLHDYSTPPSACTGRKTA